MTYQLRRQIIPHGNTAVYKERIAFRTHKPEGYIRTSGYATQPTRVWSVIHTQSRARDHFLQGAHAVAWLLTITKPGDTLDEGTWTAINTANPDMLPQFRKITGQNWKPAAEQAQLF